MTNFQFNACAGRLSARKSIYFATGLAFVFLLTSCSKKINFSDSAVVPAAQGYVKMKKDKNGNFDLDIRIVNLAPPSKLQPPASTYLVWMDTEQNGTKNLGKITSADNLLSKLLRASLTSVTPFKPTRVYVTAENDAMVSIPGGTTVLTTSNF